MVEFTDRQIRDIGAARGFGNMTYGEIAAYINNKHGLSVSEDQVGRKVRELEEKSAQGDPTSVLNRVAQKAYVDDVHDAMGL